MFCFGGMFPDTSHYSERLDMAYKLAQAAHEQLIRDKKRYEEEMNKKEAENRRVINDNIEPFEVIDL